MLTRQPVRPLCSDCNRLPARANGLSAKGFQRWHKLCGSCAKRRYTQPKQKADRCSSCGFVAEHSCQLDLVGDRTVCANCHRLEIKDNNEQRREGREVTVDATVDWNDITL